MSASPALRTIHARVVGEPVAGRERLSGLACPHVLPFQAFLQSDKAAYLLRPHVFADLYHRLSTRPFLSAIEKVRPPRPAACMPAALACMPAMLGLIDSWRGASTYLAHSKQMLRSTSVSCVSCRTSAAMHALFT